jgi:AraC-like DNA-binding protein/mannose-6-phosphate isomerase-like protein (cupin superfamily)
MNTSREDIRLAAGETYRLLRWSRNVNRVEVVRGPGRGTPTVGHGDHWHYHPETELTLIESGTGTRFVADQIELFEPGDLVLIGANVPHYWHFRGATAGLSLQWDFPLDHGIWSFAEAAAPLQRLAESARRGLCLRGRTAETIRRAMQDLPELAALPRLTAFLQLLSVLVSANPRDIRPLSPRPFSISGTVEQQDAMRRAVSYIIAHYREPVRLPDLLRLTGMSRATFERQFHRHAGKSFSVFLNQVRLRAVCRALQETTEPISTIAFSHGFNQLSFFNRLFKRELHTNPGTWRNQATPGNVFVAADPD